MIYEKIQILRNPAWNSMAKFSHFEVPQNRNPRTKCTQKVLGTTTFKPEHVCEISFRLLNIFEKLWHEERIALDREEEKEKETRFNTLLLVTV